MWFKNECNRTSERLWEYASQRLSASETTQIETHLQQCARCQAEADAYRQTVGMLGAARQMPVPASQTTWRDLRPSLAPNRRPVLRSADFLPRLTLVGAGAALGATLLVVFFSGGHNRTLTGNPSSTSPQTVVSGRTNSPTATDVATSDNSDKGQSEHVSPGSSFGSFFPNVPSVFATTPESAPPERENSAPGPKAPTVHRHHSTYSPRSSRYASIVEHPKSPAPSADPDAQNVTPSSPVKHVVNVASSSSDDDTAHLPVSSIITVASNEGAEE